MKPALCFVRPGEGCIEMCIQYTSAGPLSVAELSIAKARWIGEALMREARVIEYDLEKSPVETIDE